MTPAAPVLHAGLVARRGRRGWSGALLRGPSGVGKSDLALRALQAGWRLVADDRTVVWTSGGRLWGAAPRTLRGLCEARGQGLVRPGPALPCAAVALVVDLAAPGAQLERLPEPVGVELEGVRLRAVVLRAADASALARLELAWAAADGA